MTRQLSIFDVANVDEPETGEAALASRWGCSAGDVWQVGRHRLMCGDSTKPDDVAALMDGKTAALVHADPPYGMGKEKDGVHNDNHYGEKLDAFQMSWWRVVRPHLADNASAYIWGNAEDLWRLWYVGGLRDSERLTMRNELVWDKGDCIGMASDTHRMYPTASERCLFFMLGEQGFNNNADNYWEGFEPIRAYLDGERVKAGWSIKEASAAAGTSGMGKHWFTISQWEMPTRERYEMLQRAANGRAFRREYDDLRREYDDLRREYDDLRREFYATRAYFDNIHEPMTDVWQYGRVLNGERWGHPTPKPVALVMRVLRSSLPDGGLVIEPFIGSGTTMVAAQMSGRTCYGMELSPHYCNITLERMAKIIGRGSIERVNN